MINLKHPNFQGFFHKNSQVIYTASTLVEQSTPSEHLIFDAYATVSGTLGFPRAGRKETWEVFGTPPKVTLR